MMVMMVDDGDLVIKWRCKLEHELLMMSMRMQCLHSRLSLLARGMENSQLYSPIRVRRRVVRKTAMDKLIAEPQIDSVERVLKLTALSSGQGKVLKIVQAVSLVGCGMVDPSSVLHMRLNRVAQMMSTARKSLRYFKTLSTARRFRERTLPKLATRESRVPKGIVMAVGDAASLVYYSLDHVLASARLGLVDLSDKAYGSIKELRNGSSLVRLCMSFVLDALALKKAYAALIELRRRRRRTRGDLGCEATLGMVEETGVVAICRRIVRNVVANVANLLLLLASLGLIALPVAAKGALSLVSGLIGLHKAFMRLE